VAAIDRDALYGKWIHSHEEDTENETVFHGAGHPFPPARGRTAVEIRADGTYVQTAPGPTDVPEESTGHWSFEGDRLIFEGPAAAPAQTWEIAAIDEDTLRVRKA
jgi:hypothetical protein